MRHISLGAQGFIVTVFSGAVFRLSPEANTCFFGLETSLTPFEITAILIIRKVYFTKQFSWA
jgi:hypothetical protein